jgi:tetratricopeptide (TPR) repeat protein
MTGNARKQSVRIIGFSMALLALCGVCAFAVQEKISPLSDYQYKRDFAQYESIKKEADVQKRADLLLAFVKDHPISRILLYAATDYMACVKPHLDKKEWAKAISMEEALMALVPTEQTVHAANIPAGVDVFLKEQLAPTQKLLLQSLTAAYYESNNFPKAAETAEKVYTMFQDKSMLLVLADVYLKLQNVDKYLAYGQKIMAEFPIEQSYRTAIQMAQVYIQKQDVNSAIGLFSKVMDAYGDKVPPGTQEAQWNATRAVAYAVIASDPYSKKDYPKAMGLYEKVVKFNPKQPDAYYFLGMCKWQAKDQAGAIDDFAKAVVLKGNYANRAQQYLEQLYKAEHNGSTDGLDQVLAKAKADVGVN